MSQWALSVRAEFMFYSLFILWFDSHTLQLVWLRNSPTVVMGGVTAIYHSSCLGSIAHFQMCTQLSNCWRGGGNRIGTVQDHTIVLVVVCTLFWIEIYGKNSVAIVRIFTHWITRFNAAVNDSGKNSTGQGVLWRGLQVKEEAGRGNYNVLSAQVWGISWPD